MKRSLLVALVFFFVALGAARAHVDEKVILRGRIGSTFDKEKVKVHDSKGQEFFLPRKAFPQNYSFKQGQDFMIEVNQKDLAKAVPVKKP